MKIKKQGISMAIVAVVVLIIMVIATVIIVATSNKENNNNEINGGNNSANGNVIDTNDKEENKNNSNKEITLEDVLNHPVTPESDFKCHNDGDGGLILYGYTGTDEIIVIPETIEGKPVRRIETYAFANDFPIKGIKLADNIVEISAMAFGGNNVLQYVVCGSSLEIIGRSAFLNCKNLIEIRFNPGLKVIGEMAFAKCKSLTSVEIPSSVEKIDGAFYGYNENFKLLVESGSYAETYAKDKNHPFEIKK